MVESVMPDPALPPAFVVYSTEGWLEDRRKAIQGLRSGILGLATDRPAAEFWENLQTRYFCSPYGGEATLGTVEVWNAPG